MRLATGPLHTGRYIPELVQNPGQYPIVNSDASKLTFTNDPRSDAAKWFFESMGNDTYRVTGNPNAAPAHDPKDDTVSLTEGPAKWFIKETDVPGIYKGGPVGRPDLHVCAKVNEGQLDAKVTSEKAMALEVRFYLVDE